MGEDEEEVIQGSLALRRGNSVLCVWNKHRGRNMKD